MLEQQTLFPASGGRDGDGSDALTLADFAQRAYLDYAISVVKGRALPDGADGQKPVQRRILFAMNEMGLAAGARPVKSARVVGDVLGRFHPHGDQAAYDAMVRMAQNFSLRYPLIDGQGNFGSRDGDGAAAMRYTEARLTPIARLLLDEIDEGTVDFMPNYDGSTQEPRLLPARLAVRSAQRRVGHRGRHGDRGAVAQPARSCGRDTAAAGQSEGDARRRACASCRHRTSPAAARSFRRHGDIRDIYASGRGSLKVRARYEFEELARGQWQLVVHELPPVDLGAARARGDRGTDESEDQGRQEGTDVRTAADQATHAVGARHCARRIRQGRRGAPGVRAAHVEDRSRRIRAHAAGADQHGNERSGQPGDDRPRRPAALQAAARDPVPSGSSSASRRCGDARSTGCRRSRTASTSSKAGRSVLLNIDKVIKLIRNSDEPKADLIKAFKLTERQAEDILEIRLRQLARLEGIKIEQELAEQRKEEAALRKLLGTDSALRKQVAREIEDDAKKYGDARRTLIEDAERAAVEVKVIDEPVTVIVSEKGFVRARTGHGHDAAAVRVQDRRCAVRRVRVPQRRPADRVGSNGRVYSVPVAQLPSARGDGAPVSFDDRARGRHAPGRLRRGHVSIRRYCWRPAMAMASRPRLATWCRGRKRASSSSRLMRVPSRCGRSWSAAKRSLDRVPLGARDACWCSTPPRSRPFRWRTRA